MMTVAGGTSTVRMAALAVAVLLILGGCAAALSGADLTALQEARGFITRAGAMYQLPSIEVIAFGSGGSSFRSGLITLGPSALRAAPVLRDFILAHETAHYVLGHDRALSLPLLGPDRQRMELDANAKAVELLERVSGWSHEQAVGTVYTVQRGITMSDCRTPWIAVPGSLR